ncbi:hypothetical protein A5722_30475 [Mycobacterium vulneris]|uniref:hypothetical protein n=1 Tax=Mycolicibacterium fortuitum TaxID=1766 RepID=UPI0005C96F9F|nr:hypothetical protein [Mycolicibacterium fortuitum]MCP3811301.1 hypothetical protein [Mycobacteriaceae bacterium Msp059]OCB47934.1 hypothetical protein A5721_07290 [Mycolicibacterium vulneris]OBK07213.1 hypothetical protein A5637_05575 [Mycolicibacterium fortuitum]OBK65717.1 hypothetical protein A5654_01750 [Mycolicibacterium fortuitum]OCB51808.1 hypothetical protein A5722_30475 [Mycolicibacterium vulneris]
MFDPSGTDDVADGTERDLADDSAPAHDEVEEQADDHGDEDPAASASDSPEGANAGRRRSRGLSRLVAFGLLPALMLVLGSAAGLLSYYDRAARVSQAAAQSSMQAARDATVELLSYNPDNAKAKLTAARDLLTGDFRDAYTSLTNDVVIPGAEQKRISATATVPAVSTTSASASHAVVLVFVNQSVVIGNDAPSETASAVEVTLDKSGDRWLISGFEPK